MAFIPPSGSCCLLPWRAGVSRAECLRAVFSCSAGFTRVLGVVVAHLRSRGVCLHAYLDVLLVLASDPVQLRWAMLVMRTFCLAGFSESGDLDLSPTQAWSTLGVACAQILAGFSAREPACSVAGGVQRLTRTPHADWTPRGRG
jgi:hypothetical protein